MIDPVEVLLVEDNPHDAQLTLRALRRSRIVNRLVHVRDGAEALAWLFEGTADGEPRRPKFVLLDLKLPRVDGFEVLRALRAHEATRLTPVIILTSSREERDIVASYDLGANSFIVKPVEFENFSAAVAEAGHYWMVVNQVQS